MQKRIILYCFILLAVTAKAQLPHVASGKISRIENFRSEFITARNIDIWLPDNYSKNERYAVLYMHDGQMLFDSTITWNKQEWKVDETIGSLISANKIKKCIVVGIWNGGVTRHKDYFPQKPYEALSQAEKDTVTAQLQNAGRTKENFEPGSDNYLRFIVRELKPYIDSVFSTKKNRANTFIAGSSMGGLIAMYAICEYPDVFGGAACMSTHWPGTFTLANNPMPRAFIGYLENHLPHLGKHKLYFDYGNKTLDALYPELQQQADAVLKEKGYTSRNWITRFYPGEEHSEVAWAKRLANPILFLLKK